MCEVAGEVRLDPSEAKDPRWVSMSGLEEIVKNRPETIFPLQLPALAYFIEHGDIDKLMA